MSSRLLVPLPVLALLGFASACPGEPAGVEATPLVAAPSGTGTSEPPPPARAARLADDPAAAAAFTRLRGAIDPAGCVPQTRAGLLELVDRFPTETELRQVTVAVLQRCDDWTGVARVLALEPEDERSPDAVTLLAKARIKAKDFEGAVELIGERAKTSEDSGVVWPAALSFYELGRYSDAAPLLDRVRVERAAAGAWDATVLRALIHLHAGELEPAEALAKQVVDADPQDRTGAHAMARVLSASGKSDEAARWFARFDDLNEAHTRAEQRALKLAALGAALEAARAQRDRERSLEILGRMRPLADPDLRARLDLVQQQIEGAK